MTTITREWLQKTIAEFETTCDEIPFGMDDDDAKILQVLKLKQASLEAEPSMSVIVKDGWPIPETITTVAGSEKLPDGVYELYIATQAASATVDELTMWVKRLAHSLRNAKPDSKLPDEAMAYLSRKGLISVVDILR